MTKQEMINFELPKPYRSSHELIEERYLKDKEQEKSKGYIDK